MSYLEDRQRYILNGRPLQKKERKPIAKKSAKRIAKEKAEREERGGDDTELQKWFNARRKEMVGTCQCGCGRKSSKHEDDHFRASASHIFPQRLFPSIQLHPLNCVERNFWDGCHSNFDHKGVKLWPNMADWDDIKEKVYQLIPLLTEKERANKFYRKLVELVYAN